jgi:hypothetical protein
MGAFQGEWHIDLHISPTTGSFCPISLAMIFIYSKDSNTKNHSVWCFGWSDTAYGCSKCSVHAAAAEAGGPDWPVLSSAALKSLKSGLHIRAELETCQLRPPALGSCKKHTHFGPQCPPSAKIQDHLERVGVVGPWGVYDFWEPPLLILIGHFLITKTRCYSWSEKLTLHPVDNRLERIVDWHPFYQPGWRQWIGVWGGAGGESEGSILWCLIPTRSVRRNFWRP